MSASNNPQSRLDETFLAAGSAAYLDEIYEQYASDPDAVSAEWRETFEILEKSPFGNDADGQKAVSGAAIDPEHLRKQGAVLRLIRKYHVFGHLQAKLDPLELTNYDTWADLSLEGVGLSEADLDSRFAMDPMIDTTMIPLREIIERYESIYCGSIGYEYIYLTEQKRLMWLQDRVERNVAQELSEFSDEERIDILQQLTMAEGLETYLHTKYVGQKRFSLEGGESLIPALHELIQLSGIVGGKEVVIGMAHRGRLNTLVNILGKAPATLFGEFEGDPKHTSKSARQGDVKYHQGFSSDIDTPGGVVHVALAFNPSHLEIIDGVVEGSVRARQHRRQDHSRNAVVPILVHGDAAFAGQGVVMELLNMSHIRGFETGGTIHIIVNNQIGFTTSNRLDARSTLHCTEIAKMVQAPIFHVNGDDPEAVVYVTRLAHAYRTEFHTDVVIDIVCYRRYGHNEADEPTMTQPVMYGAIKSRDPIRRRYGTRLVEDGVLQEEQLTRMLLDYRDSLDRGEVVVGQVTDPQKAEKMVDWTPYLGGSWTEPVDTTITLITIRRLTEKLAQLPEGFSLHPRVQKIVNDRSEMSKGKIPIDWGFAEVTAYAALVEEGYQVRLSGQDSGRGTFSHRHALLHDQNSRKVYVPLKSIGEPHDCQVYNSVLSEEAVVAFEYGYAATDPQSLVIWEAQFGDFANGAQIVIDQFISSGESKWGRLCGLTMMLPHGYEGQGPEHSSARLERFLQLCAKENMQVCVPTTPAQQFHLLRRQVMRKYRKPLIIMSPKSLLRHKQSVSDVRDLTRYGFQLIIDEIEENFNREEVDRVILCAGKVYFDLLAMRQRLKMHKVVILRIEQLYPFPRDDLRALLSTYPNARDVVWCQEEPKNQGAWFHMRSRVKSCLADGQNLRRASRGGAASPAVGHYRAHLNQQQELINRALAVGKR